MKETMGQFAREMERAGLIDEVVNDTFESIQVTCVTSIATESTINI